MPDEDTRQEIEELRARLDALSSNREEVSPENSLDDIRQENGGEAPPVVEPGPNGLIDEASNCRIPKTDQQRSKTTDDKKVAGRFDLLPSEQIMSGMVILAITLTVLVWGEIF